MDEKGKESLEEVFVPGRDKPRTTPPGRQWYAVRGLDPTKSPEEISGWRLGSKPTPQGEFTLPPELEHFRGKLIKQEDFFKKVDDT
ncbi:MAG: hypothetical protein ACOYT7_01345 [Patescibacteria group bacterium]